MKCITITKHASIKCRTRLGISGFQLIKSMNLLFSEKDYKQRSDYALFAHQKGIVIIMNHFKIITVYKNKNYPKKYDKEIKTTIYKQRESGD